MQEVAGTLKNKVLIVTTLLVRLYRTRVVTDWCLAIHDGMVLINSGLIVGWPRIHGLTIV